MAAEVDIPETGAVFTFGRSRFADNIPGRFWVRNDPILQLACGDQHTALVTESGRIFMFGPNDWGQLGLGHSRHVNKPSCIKALKQEKVSLVACGGCHTLIATDSGKIYSFGANGEGQLGVVGIEKSVEPYHIKKLPSCIRYKALAAGFEHSVCLTESGSVYVWGSNSEGQLGFGDLTESYVPTQLLAEETMKSVAVGYYHTALLTENGSVYIFGETEGGKLGLGDEVKKCRTPVKLASFDTTVQSISCGSSYTALITKQNELYTFGTGSNGELGHGTSQQMLSTPKKVCLPFKVKSVSCGANHTAIITEDGYLYTFGDSRHGKLAQGEDSYSNLFQPCLVEQFKSYVIDKVVCGGCHTMVVAHQKPSFNTSQPENTNSSAKTFKILPPATLSNSTDFSGTLSARDRRRQTTESTNTSLNRTLPSLSGKAVSGSLLTSSTLENVLCPSSEENHIPQLDRTLSNGKCLTENLEDSEEKAENYSVKVEEVEEDVTKIFAKKENDSVKELLPDVVSLNEEILEKEFTVNKQDLPVEHSQKLPLSNGVILDQTENEECLKDVPIPMKLETNLQNKNQEEPKYLNSKESIGQKGKEEDGEEEMKEICCSEEELIIGEDEEERKRREKNKNGAKRKRKEKKQKGKKQNKGVEGNEKRIEEEEKFTEGQQDEVEGEEEAEEEEVEEDRKKENEEDLEKNNKNKQKSKKGILNIFGKKKEDEIENKEGKNVEKESEEKEESPRKKKESRKKEIKSDEDKEKEEEKVKGKSGKKQNHAKPDSVEEEEEEEVEQKEKEKEGETEDAKAEKGEEDKKKETEKSETILENEEKDKNSRTCLIL